MINLKNRNYVAFTGLYSSSSQKPEYTIEEKQRQPDSSRYVFDYIPEKIYEQVRCKEICPNTLNSANQDLRRGKSLNELYDLDKELVSALDTAFEALPAITEEQTLWRALYGMHLGDDFLDAAEGDTVVPDKGFAQVGLTRAQAEYYLPSQSCKPVLLEIICPKGAKVSSVPGVQTGSGYPEAFLPRNIKYKVLKKETVTYPPLSDYDDAKSVRKYTLLYLE